MSSSADSTPRRSSAANPYAREAYPRDAYPRDPYDRDRYDNRYAWERERARNDYDARGYDPRGYGARGELDRDRLLGRDFDHDRWAGRRHERYDRDESRDDLDRGRHYFDDYPWSKPRW